MGPCCQMRLRMRARLGLAQLCDPEASRDIIKLVYRIYRSHNLTIVSCLIAHVTPPHLHIVLSMSAKTGRFSMG